MDEVQGPQIEEALLTFLVFVAGMIRLPQSLVLWIAYPMMYLLIVELQEHMVPPTDDDIDQIMGIPGYSESRRKWIEEERRRKK